MKKYEISQISLMYMVELTLKDKIKVETNEKISSL